MESSSGTVSHNEHFLPLKKKVCFALKKKKFCCVCMYINIKTCRLFHFYDGMFLETPLVVSP